VGLVSASKVEAPPARTHLLTADDLAVRWSVSKDHVYRLAREGRIPTVAIGRYYRFREASIETWELAQEGVSGG
jgi:excisionase family DNA binding protein